MNKRLNVPYLSQRDNRFNPDGSCNVTSIAMCLAYYGIPVRINGGQLEDVLYQECYRRGLSRHSPLDLAKLSRDWSKEYGKPVFNNFTIYGSQQEIIKTIDSGHPCVTHGYFTSFGHIIVICGYDQKGCIVHDPYGEWFRSGYDRNTPSNQNKGKFLHYSWGLMKETCYDPRDNSWWLHRFNGNIEPSYTNLGNSKPRLKGKRLQDIFEEKIEVKISIDVQLDVSLAWQIQVCLNNHLKVNPSITVDGILGNQTIGAYNQAMEKEKMPTGILTPDHARLLIQGHR